MMFAAGFGTRMGALTADQPKPLIKVAGKALIDHALDVVDAFGTLQTVVNLHYRPDQLALHLAGRNVLLSYEQPNILETGGGLRNALPLLGDGPVFTTNTDAIWRGPNPFRLLADMWDPTQMDALLLCIPPDQAEGHAGTGDFLIDAQGRASRGPDLIYSGVQIIRTDGLHDVPDHSFSLNLLWDRMLENHRLFALPYPGRWCDVGRPEGLSVAEAMLDQPDV